MEPDVFEKVDRLSVVTVHLMESARLNCGRVLYTDIGNAIDGWLTEREQILRELDAMGIFIAMPDSVYRGRLPPDIPEG